MKKLKGFTLIELLIVIGIIAILAGIVIIAVNPAKQFGQANDAQRQSDINAILNAVSQYGAEHRGQVPPGGFITSVTQTLANEPASGTGAAFELCNVLVPEFISALPVDPTGTGGVASHYTDCTFFNTGYEISRNTNGRITVNAPYAEQTPGVTITR